MAAAAMMTCVVYVWRTEHNRKRLRKFFFCPLPPAAAADVAVTSVQPRAAPHLSLITALKQAFAVSSYQLNPFPVAE